MVKAVHQQPKYECEVCGAVYRSKKWAERCESRVAPNFRYNTGDLAPLNDGCGDLHFIGIVERFVAPKHTPAYTAENPHEPGYFLAYPESMLVAQLCTDTRLQLPTSLPWMSDKMTNIKLYPILVAMSIDKREEWDFRDRITKKR